MEILSPAWFDALGAALARAPVPETSGRLSIGQLVTGAPAGDVCYTIHLGGGGPAALEVGSTASATVVLVEDFPTAQAVAAGASVADVLAEGRIKVRGDARALVGAHEALARLAGVLAEAGG